ncbi:MAG: ABC transporter permease [Ruminococcaceae bacterium]|nr:ABC transporter permease [Oscillospiraceae bacterium]
MLQTLKKHQFLFEELVKRDFKQKYKRTVLGMGWSILSPLLTLLVMALVFTNLLGRDTPHFIIYLFAGNIVMSFFKESTKGGMNALMANARIFTKVNVPKYLFLLSKNVSTLVNFGLILGIYFLFVVWDGLPIGPHLLMLLYPIFCLLLFNIGVGMILSALYVFFRDTQYLYDVFLVLLTYLSAIFYNVNRFPALIQRLFLLNPVYCYIRYFRLVTIDGIIPSLPYHGLCLLYAALALLAGIWVYRRNNHKFLYYV